MKTYTEQEFLKLPDIEKCQMTAECIFNEKYFIFTTHPPEHLTYFAKGKKDGIGIVRTQLPDYCHSDAGRVEMEDWWLNRYGMLKLYKTKDGILFEYINYGSTDEMWRIEFACETINLALMIAICKMSGRIKEE